MEMVLLIADSVEVRTSAQSSDGNVLVAGCVAALCIYLIIDESVWVAVLLPLPVFSLIAAVIRRSLGEEHLGVVLNEDHALWIDRATPRAVCCVAGILSYAELLYLWNNTPGFTTKWLVAGVVATSIYLLLLIMEFLYCQYSAGVKAAAEDEQESEDKLLPWFNVGWVQFLIVYCGFIFAGIFIHWSGDHETASIIGFVIMAVPSFYAVVYGLATFFMVTSCIKNTLLLIMTYIRSLIDRGSRPSNNIPAGRVVVVTQVEPVPSHHKDTEHPVEPVAPHHDDAGHPRKEQEGMPATPAEMV